MIIDVHVHPVFQEISDRPEMARTIQQLELTSKRYFCRSQNIQSLSVARARKNPVFVLKQRCRSACMQRSLRLAKVTQRGCAHI